MSSCFLLSLSTSHCLSIYTLNLPVYSIETNVLVVFRIKFSALSKLSSSHWIFHREQSAESFVNLALLLSRIIHKFSLLGLTGFYCELSEILSDVPDCTGKLWALQPCLLPADSNQSNSSSPWQRRVKGVMGNLSRWEEESNVMGL